MKITITTEFDSVEAARAFLRQLEVRTSGPATTEVVSAEKEKPEAPAPKKTRAKKVEPVDSAPAAAEPGKIISNSDAQAALEKLFATKGMETCREAMSRFGVQRLKDLKPEQYAPFIEHVESVLAGGEV